MTISFWYTNYFWEDHVLTKNQGGWPRVDQCFFGLGSEDRLHWTARDIPQVEVLCWTVVATQLGEYVFFLQWTFLCKNAKRVLPISSFTQFTLLVEFSSFHSWVSWNVPAKIRLPPIGLRHRESSEVWVPNPLEALSFALKLDGEDGMGW